MQIHLTPGEKKSFRITTARQVPLHWKEKAEKIVNKLLREKVITRQVEPTEWCAPGFFVIKKSGDLRLVVDYTQLNKHVRRPIHTFPSTQEILAGLDPTSRVFAKLDATQGYHQIPLEEESSKLTTFLLPSGRFQYLRAETFLFNRKNANLNNFSNFNSSNIKSINRGRTSPLSRNLPNIWRGGVPYTVYLC